MRLFADDLNKNSTASGSGVEVDQDDLLPGAKLQVAAYDGYG